LTSRTGFIHRNVFLKTMKAKQGFLTDLHRKIYEIKNEIHVFRK